MKKRILSVLLSAALITNICMTALTVSASSLDGECASQEYTAASEDIVDASSEEALTSETPSEAYTDVNNTADSDFNQAAFYTETNLTDAFASDTASEPSDSVAPTADSELPNALTPVTDTIDSSMELETIPTYGDLLDENPTYPVLVSLSLEKKSLCSGRGDSARIELTLQNLPSNTDILFISFRNEFLDTAITTDLHPSSSGYAGNIYVNSSTPSGIYTIDSIAIQDIGSSTPSEYVFIPESLQNTSINVFYSDTTEPEIYSISTDKSTYTIGDTITITAIAQDDLSGAEQMELIFSRYMENNVGDLMFAGQLGIGLPRDFITNESNASFS